MEKVKINFDFQKFLESQKEICDYTGEYFDNNLHTQLKYNIELIIKGKIEDNLDKHFNFYLAEISVDYRFYINKKWCLTVGENDIIVLMVLDIITEAIPGTLLLI